MTEQTERQLIIADLLDEKGFSEEAAAFRHGALLGRSFYFRTLGEIRVGRIVGVTQDSYILEQAGWVADSGPRWGQCVAGGLNYSENVEYEYEGDGVLLRRDANIALIPYRGDLPTESI